MRTRSLLGWIAALLFSAGVLHGCVRDDVDSPGGGEYPQIEPDDYALGFDFMLDVLPSADGTTRAVGTNITRANFHPTNDDPDYWECYIDFNHEHKSVRGDEYSFHLLIFDEENHFLYNATAPAQTNREWYYIIPLGMNDNGELLRWRVVFNVPSQVREYIKAHPFKLAIMANWPTRLEAKGGGMEDVMPAEFQTRKPWGGDEYNPEKGGTPLSIRKIAHSIWDSFYDNEDKREYYDFLFNDDEFGKMDPYTDWALLYHDTEDAAENFIRGFGVDAIEYNRREHGEMIRKISNKYHDYVPNPQTFRRDFAEEDFPDQRVFVYEYLWRLWNFGGFANANVDEVTDDGNGNVINCKPEPEPVDLGIGFSGKTDPSNLNYMYYGKSYGDDKTFDYVYRWSYLNEQRFQKISGNLTSTDFRDRWAAGENPSVSLPSGTAFATGTTDRFDATGLDSVYDFVDETSTEKGALVYTGSKPAQFKCDADGHIYLELPKGSASDNYLELQAFTASTLYIKAKNMKSLDIDSKSYEFSFTRSNSDEPGENAWALEIPNMASPVKIFSKSDSEPLQIYEIEVVHKRYLYLSDRRTLLPTSHQLVPMYGLQQYDPLGEYWVPGEVFDLSHRNGLNKPGYFHKPLYLLRSVAKVELLISKQFQADFESAHPGEEYRPRILMRSMNRQARCMPLDVTSPTEEVWAGVDRELLNIQQNGPFFDHPKYTKGDVQSFQSVLGWFYSLWETVWGWDWRNKSLDIDRTYESPRVFNAKIQRSDFLRFIQLQDQGNYSRYVFYMPEKMIDDPTNAGELESTPKVPHMELRLKGESVLNLDDDDNDRLYFMDYATTGGPGNVTNWNAYEKNRENLSKHWPVIRNHVYRFTIEKSGKDGIKVQSMVANSAGRSVDIPAFD